MFKFKSEGFQWFDSGAQGRVKLNVNVEVSIRCTVSFYFVGVMLFYCVLQLGKKKVALEILMCKSTFYFLVVGILIVNTFFW